MPVKVKYPDASMFAWPVVRGNKTQIVKKRRNVYNILYRS